MRLIDSPGLTRTQILRSGHTVEPNRLTITWFSGDFSSIKKKLDI